MIEWILLPIIFGGVIVQSAAGFGVGLISMPLLVQAVGIEMAAPFFALTVSTGNIMMMVRYRRDLHFHHIWRLALAAIISIPLGVWLAGYLDERLVISALGLFVMAYGLYALIGPQMPTISNPRWGYGFGLISGVLSGAYNTGGPPLIVYASSQRWPLATFKGNLQAIFFITAIVVILSHLAAGHITGAVLLNAALALPVVFIAQIVGAQADRILSPEQFRKLVPLMLIVLGLTLIF